MRAPLVRPLGGKAATAAFGQGWPGVARLGRRGGVEGARPWGWHERQGAELQTKLGCERVPLRRAQDRVRESASLDDLFGRELAAVVAERDLVDADDRDVDDVRLDPCTSRGIEQPPGAFNVGALRLRVAGDAAGFAREVSDL